MKLHGPFKFSFKLCFTDGNKIAELSYEFPQGKIPSDKAIKTAIKNASEYVNSSLGGEFRLANKEEMFDNIIADKLGAPIKVARPFSSKEWDAFDFFGED